MTTQRSTKVSNDIDFHESVKTHEDVLNACLTTFTQRCDAIQKYYKAYLPEKLIATQVNNIKQEFEKLRTGFQAKVKETDSKIDKEISDNRAVVEEHKSNVKQYAARRIQAELANALKIAIERSRDKEQLSATEEYVIKALTGDFASQHYTTQIEILDGIFGYFFSAEKLSHPFTNTLRKSIEETTIKTFVKFEGGKVSPIRVRMNPDDLNEIGKPDMNNAIEAEEDAARRRIDITFLVGMAQLDAYKVNTITPAINALDKTLDALEKSLTEQAIPLLKERAKKVLDNNQKELENFATVQFNLRSTANFLPPEVAKLTHPRLQKVADIIIEDGLFSEDCITCMRTKRIIKKTITETTEVLRDKNALIISELINLDASDWRIAKTALKNINEHIEISEKAIKESKLSERQEKMKNEMSDYFAPALAKLNMISKVLESIKAETDRLQTKKGLFLFQIPGADKAKRINEAIKRVLDSEEFLDHVRRSDVKRCVDFVLNFRCIAGRKMLPSIKDALQENRGFFNASTAFARVHAEITRTQFTKRR